MVLSEREKGQTMKKQEKIIDGIMFWIQDYKDGFITANECLNQILKTLAEMF